MKDWNILWLFSVIYYILITSSVVVHQMPAESKKIITTLQMQPSIHIYPEEDIMIICNLNIFYVGATSATPGKPNHNLISSLKVSLSLKTIIGCSGCSQPPPRPMFCEQLLFHEQLLLYIQLQHQLSLHHLMMLQTDGSWRTAKKIYWILMGLVPRCSFACTSSLLLDLEVSDV